MAGSWHALTLKSKGQRSYLNPNSWELKSARRGYACRYDYAFLLFVYRSNFEQVLSWNPEISRSCYQNF